MANLFHETQSFLFRKLCFIISRMYTGEKYRCGDILDELHSASLQTKKPADVSVEEEENLVDSVFLFDTPDINAEAKLFYPAPIPSIPSLLELRWLKTMLTDDSAEFLLEMPLRKKLLEKLTNIDVLPVSTLWEKQQNIGDTPISEPFHTHLKIIWQALRKQKKLHYINIDEQNRHREYTQEPCRLEYNAAENRYRVIFWNREENRAVCVVVSRLLSVSITDEPISSDINHLFREFLDSHREKFTIRLQKKNNAVDRCFSLFSSNDKDAFLNDDGTYMITIYYYAFDKEEICQKILSLGSAVTVIDPVPLRTEIIERLKGALLKNRDMAPVSFNSAQ